MLGRQGEDSAHTSRTSPRGVTLIEMLAVLAIILILTSSIVSGFTNMQRAQRLNRSNEKLLSTLNLTRNLAISNNAVAYLEIVGTSPEVIAETGSKQALIIHIFPNPADALTVNGEPAANISVPNTHSTTPANLIELAPNAWNPTKNKGWVEPLSIPYQDGTSNPIPGYGMAYNNFTPETIRVEPTTLIGSIPVAIPVDATGTAPILIGFNPDGTLVNAAAIKLYVTDDPKRLYGPPNPTIETTLEDIVNTKHTPDPHLKVIDLFGGGLIKQEL
jgi:prepilin-type N-terminal cleavage/methylation domain-containing protein